MSEGRGGLAEPEALSVRMEAVVYYRRLDHGGSKGGVQRSQTGETLEEKCPSFISVAMIECPDIKNLGDKGFILAHISTSLSIIVVKSYSQSRAERE